MATSSIFANVVIDDEEAVLKIAELYEEGEKEPPRQMTCEHPVAEPDEIDDFFRGRELG